MQEEFEQCEVSVSGVRPDYCYHNNKKIEELEKSIEELRSSMKSFREKSDERDDKLFDHILQIETRVNETERKHEVLLTANTKALQHLEATLNNLARVNDKTIDTLAKMDKQLVEATDHADYTDMRIGVVEDDIKGMKNTISAVRGELRTVDDKTKVDVALTWTEQFKKNLPTLLAGGGIAGVALTILKQIMG